MAAQKVVVDGSNISAGQMKDFWRQVADGSITGEMFRSFLERRNPFEEKPVAKLIGDMFTRHVTVDRTRSPQDAIAATGRNQYVNEKVIAMMPRGDGNEVDVVFFKLGRSVSDDDLEKEYKLRGLVPVDLYALAAVNEADPAFADEHPNITHWKDVDGRWCYTAFFRWRGVRRVNVDRGGDVWVDAFWWFAGRRK